MLFNQMNLKPEILKVLTEINYQIPTEVQQKVIPKILSDNNDLIALSSTGTGKTAAFSVPIISKIIDSTNNQIQALVLCPTRELCLQICRDIKIYTKYLDFNTVALYGGASIVNQIKELKRGNIQLVVATPGRILDLIKRKKINLSNVEYLVLDEADEMLNMGFKEDLDEILKSLTIAKKQTLLFSATMPSHIADIAKNYMNKPLTISIKKTKQTKSNIEHIFYLTSAKARYETLKRIVDYNPNIYSIIFCRTRQQTKELAEKLIKDGYSSEALHGDISQAQRDYVMNLFREKHIKVLVATDVAARGIDVNNLTHVINYHLPDETDIYIHRSGRTGRADKNGIAVSIITQAEHKKIKLIEQKINTKIDEQPIPNGLVICEKQLFYLINKVNETKVDDEQIAKYLTACYEKFAHLSKEQLIKKLVSVEFNRFLEYYKNSKDINIKLKFSKDKDNKRSKQTSKQKFNKRFKSKRFDKSNDFGDGKFNKSKPKNKKYAHKSFKKIKK